MLSAMSEEMEKAAETDLLKKSHANNYLVEETLRDGHTIVIRAIRPDDKPILQEGIHHLKRESLYFRFFTPKNELTEAELVYFTEVDFVQHVGLVASLISRHGHEFPIGVARYIMASKDQNSLSAEVAFAVTEECQGRGVGSLLLKHLAIIARQEGLTTFKAFVLAENIRMMKVFAHSGLPMNEVNREGNVIEISLSLL